MPYQLQFQPSPKLAVNMTRRVWLRRDGRSYFFYGGIPALTASMCAFSPEMTSSRAGMLVIGLLSGIALTFGWLYAFGFFRFAKSAKEATRQWCQDLVVVELDDEGIGEHFQGANNRYDWKNIKRLWQQPSGWLLFASETRFFAIPTECLNEEVSGFILHNLEKVGAKMMR